MFRNFCLFAKRVSTTYDKHHDKLATAAIGAGWANSAYWLFNMDKLAEMHVNAYINSLTPEQRKEMQSSPEQNKKYLEDCKERIRQSMRPD